MLFNAFIFITIKIEKKEEERKRTEQKTTTTRNYNKTVVKKYMNLRPNNGL